MKDSYRSARFDLFKTILFSTLLLGNNTFCQAPDPKFHTPDASSFMKFIDNQVSPHTGSVDISIPITIIDDGNISIPIVLKYNTSGIKTMEEASWVGLGWNLNVGGMITHSMNGEADNSSDFYELLNSPYIERSPDGYANILDDSNLLLVGTNYYNPESAYLDPINAILKSYDGFTNPDVYYYSFLNYSGKFHVHPITNEVRLVNQEDRISFKTFNDQSGNTYWKAITPDGTTFFFGKTITSISPTSTRASSVNFYLTQIIYPDGEFVTFNYNIDSSSLFVFNSSYKKITHLGVMELGPALYQNNYNSCTLSSISTPNILVSFSTVKDRLDLPGERRLNSIIVSDKTNSLLKSFTFSYDYFTSVIAGNYQSQHPNFVVERALKRLRLIGFAEDGLPPYSFSYFGGLPIKTTYAVDYWGYYNGETSNEVLYPKYLDIYPGDDSFPIKSGANRASNIDFAIAGMLYSVTYPTGGKRTIEYESNTFDNYNILSQQQLDSYEVTSSTSTFISDYNEPTDITYYHFYVDKPTRIKIVGHISRGTGTYDDVKDASITFGYYTTTYTTWNMVGMYNELNLDFEYDTIIDLKPYYPYRVNVSIPDVLGPQGYASSKHISASAIIYINETQLTDFDFSEGGGIRVARELLFNEGEDEPCLINKYDYGFGSLMTPLKFHYTYYYARYPDYAYNCHDFTDYELTSSNWYPENTYAPGIVGYSNVSVHTEGLANWTSGQNNYDVGKTYYTFLEQAGEGSNYMNYIYGAPLWGQPLNGRLKKKEIYDKFNTMISKEEYFYSYTSEPFFWGLYAINYNRGCDLHGGTYGQAVTYPIKSFTVHADKKSETFNNVTKETYYKYNSIGQVIRDSIYTSTGSLMKTIYGYPYDLSSTDPVLLEMKNANLLDRLVFREIQSPINVIFKEKFTYSQTASIPNPYNSETTKIFSITQRDIYQNNLATPVNSEYYTYNPKLARAKRKDNFSISYLWGYNKNLPICKAENTDDADICFCNFEVSNEYGGWTYQSGSRSTTYARTGRYSCVNAIMQKIVSVSSIVSLWVKSGGGTPSISGYTPKVYAATDGWTYYEWNVSPGSITVYGSNCYIDDLRLHPEGAMMTSYTYDPLVGMTSSTDPNGIITRYEYDSFGRLKNMKDNDGKITARNYYHYYNDTSSDTPYLNTSPTSMSFGSGASSSSLTITSNTTWSISDNATWLSVNTSSGTGNATVSISATANTSAARNATITITYAGSLTKTVSVSQAAGSTSTLVVSPMTINFGYLPPPVTVTVTSNTSWTVTTSDSWIRISATSRTGNGTITVMGKKLLSGTRSGTVTFKTTDNTVTRIVNVYQDAELMEQ